MAIYTSRINYSGNKIKIDITAKSATGIGRHFKPTWKMVLDYKATKNETWYIHEYHQILEDNYYYIRQLADYAKDHDVVLVCYCKAGNFCHRVLLAEYIDGLFNVKYKGEI